MPVSQAVRAQTGADTASENRYPRFAGIGDAMPQRFDFSGRGELERGEAAACLESGGDHPPHRIACMVAAMGAEDRGATATRALHAHRVRRHVEFLGDEAEGWHVVVGMGAGGPNHLDSACRTINSGWGQMARAAAMECPPEGSPTACIVAGDGLFSGECMGSVI